MKNKVKIFFSLLVWILVVAACNPENPHLSPLMPKSALKFSVTPLSSNPNLFVLKSETPGVTPYWVTPVGTSTKAIDTVNIPFPGVDTVRYSVTGAGGITEADTVINITTIDANFVSDTTWTDLTGGLGNSKTWVLDLDSSGVSKYFDGPIYFGGTGWEWDPAWKDNTWICAAADYGTMTFSLKGNVIFISDNKQLSDGSGTGKYMLWPGSQELQTYGAQLVHDPSQGPRVPNWYAKVKIKSITANTLQLIIPNLDGNPDAWIIYNYVTLDYYNSH